MTFRKANTEMDFDPKEYHGENEVSDLKLIQESDQKKNNEFTRMVNSIIEYFRDMREEIEDHALFKIKEKHPGINSKLIKGVIHLIYLPMVTILIIALNQTQYYI